MWIIYPYIAVDQDERCDASMTCTGRNLWDVVIWLVLVDDICSPQVTFSWVDWTSRLSRTMFTNRIWELSVVWGPVLLRHYFDVHIQISLNRASHTFVAISVGIFYFSNSKYWLYLRHDSTRTTPSNAPYFWPLPTSWPDSSINLSPTSATTFQCTPLMPHGGSCTFKGFPIENVEAYRHQTEVSM